MFQGYLNVSLEHPRALGGVLQKVIFQQTSNMNT